MSGAGGGSTGVGIRRSGRVWSAILVVSILWGTMGFATQAALRQGLTPYRLTALRMALASLILIVYLIATRTKVRASPHLLSDGVVTALGQVVMPSVLFATALQRLPASAVCLLYALVPAATIVWFRLSSRTRSLGSTAGVGLGLAFAGTVLVVLNSTPRGHSPGDTYLGLGMVAAAVVVTSGHSLYAKRHADHPLFEVIAPQILIGTILLLAPGIISNAMEIEAISLHTGD